MPAFIDLTGQTFGRLAVIERADNTPQGKARWLCRCACGNESIVSAYNLRSSNTKSCGCFRRGVLAETVVRNFTHGHRRGGTTPTYSSWLSMKARCFNPNADSYRWYGAAGVTICDRWLGPEGFTNFLADMGPRPDGMSLDRIDPFGNYMPSNCRWADAKTQANNKRPRAA